MMEIPNMATASIVSLSRKNDYEANPFLKRIGGHLAPSVSEQHMYAAMQGLFCIFVLNDNSQSFDVHRLFINNVFANVRLFEMML